MEIKPFKKEENDTENLSAEKKKDFKNRFLNNFKKIKKPEILLIITVIVIVIVAYMLYSSGKIIGTSSDASSSSTEIESRLEEILSKINGVGKVKVMIYYENSLNNSDDGSISFNSGYFSSSKSYEIKGVLVVAEGADNMEVKVQILRAVETLLSINADCIEIFTMNN